MDNCDEVYRERDQCLVLIALMAQKLGLKVGISRHVDKPGEQWEDDWRNVLFIDLPAGQVSWHIHDSEAQWFYFVGAYDSEWDGHTTEEKYHRVLEPGLNVSTTAALAPTASISDVIGAIGDVAELAGWPCIDSDRGDGNFMMTFKRGGL